MWGRAGLMRRPWWRAPQVSARPRQPTTRRESWSPAAPGRSWRRGAVPACERLGDRPDLDADAAQLLAQRDLAGQPRIGAHLDQLGDGLEHHLLVLAARRQLVGPGGTDVDVAGAAGAGAAAGAFDADIGLAQHFHQRSGAAGFERVPLAVAVGDEDFHSHLLLSLKKRRAAAGPRARRRC